MRILIIVLLVMSTGFLSSCLVTFGDYNGSEFTRLSHDTCILKPNDIYIFFDGKKIDFEYKKIGLVEAEGKKYASNEIVLNHLKYKAHINCANAIINVEKDYKDREEGLFYSTNEVYSSLDYRGIAVYVNIDSTFLRKYSGLRDLSFIQKVEEENRKYDNRTNNQMIGSLLLGLAAVIYFLINLD